MAIVTPIDGEVGGRRRYHLQNPATLAPVGELDCATVEEVRDAIARASTAQPPTDDAAPPNFKDA